MFAGRHGEKNPPVTFAVHLARTMRSRPNKNITEYRLCASGLARYHTVTSSSLVSTHTRVLRCLLLLELNNSDAVYYLLNMSRS